MHIRKNYQHTLYASYLGYMTQAMVNNFAPLLFLTFQQSYRIDLRQITLLVTINFMVQLTVDFLAARFVDRIGYRPFIVLAHICAAAGLAGLGLFPAFFPTPYSGLVTAVILYAIGGGLIEVLVSPIVEACPTPNKSAAMSLLHSFYCWGSVAVIALSTLLFSLVGMENWSFIACLWAVLPAFNALYFSQVPLLSVKTQEENPALSGLLKQKAFWILALLMICSGASELAMSQWASAFAESALHVSKITGDLAGPCFFAILMGSARVLYAKLADRVSLNRYMIGCACLCIAGYGLAAFSPIPLLSLMGCGLCGFGVGVMWPGTFSMAARLCPGSGTSLFAMLALAGDLGCTTGPAVVGTVSQVFSGHLQTGLAAAALFPLLLIVGILLLRRQHSA